MSKFGENWCWWTKVIFWPNYFYQIIDLEVKILNFKMLKTVHRLPLLSFCYDFLKLINKQHLKDPYFAIIF